MFQFSPHGVKNTDLYAMIYQEFIDWCKELVPFGTFSTYLDGEPVLFYNGLEISYRDFLNSINPITTRQQ